MASVQDFRDFINERLKAAAGEIFAVFEQTIVRYEEEIDRHRRLLEICWKPRIKLHRTELKKHHDCTEDTNDCLVQGEPQPTQIKEEQEDPELLHLKKEQDEVEPLQTEEDQDLGTSQEGEQLMLLQFESVPCQVPSIEEQSFRSEPEEEPNTEQFLFHDSEAHDVKNHADLETARNARVKRIMALQSVAVDSLPVSEEQAECEELLSEGTCGEIVLKKQKLCQNLGTATDKKIKICEICGKSFKKQRKLVIHMRTHTGERPYPCDSCGKRFKQRCHLVYHTRTHTGEKPYPCGTCGKRFRRSFHLVIHMRTHTGEKPYCCDLCGKSFSQYVSLQRHMETHKNMYGNSKGLDGRSPSGSSL